MILVYSELCNHLIVLLILEHFITPVETPYLLAVTPHFRLPYTLCMCVCVCVCMYACAQEHARMLTH